MTVGIKNRNCWNGNELPSPKLYRLKGLFASDIWSYKENQATTTKKKKKQSRTYGSVSGVWEWVLLLIPSAFGKSILNKLLTKNQYEAVDITEKQNCKQKNKQNKVGPKLHSCYLSKIPGAEQTKKEE